jgi:hypothetical protein
MPLAFSRLLRNMNFLFYSGVNKHVFPKEPKKLEMWLRAIPRENWTPSPHSIICSLHFDESDYKTERTVRPHPTPWGPVPLNFSVFS